MNPAAIIVTLGVAGYFIAYGYHLGWFILGLQVGMLLMYAVCTRAIDKASRKLDR